jgi:hypothetical protein
MSKPTDLRKYNKVDKEYFWLWYKRIDPEQLEDFKMNENGKEVSYYISKKFFKEVIREMER